MDRHFALQGLQGFYYKHRELSGVYADMCIHYCELDIAQLPSVQREHEEAEASRAKNMLDSGAITMQEYRKAINDIGRFEGRIAAFDTMLKIYKASGHLHKALDVCDSAIAYYGGSDYFETATAGLLKKLGSAR